MKSICLFEISNYSGGKLARRWNKKMYKEVVLVVKENLKTEKIFGLD